MVAANAKQIIHDKGLKQKFVAERAGYSKKRFNDLLNGRLIIRPNDIMKIAQALDVTPNDLFGIKSDNNSSGENKTKSA